MPTSKALISRPSGPWLYVAESDEARYTLYLSDVYTIENAGHPGIVLQGNTFTVRFNDSNLLHKYILLKVDAEQHLDSLEKSRRQGKTFRG
jgi:hypothetical protein